MHEVGLYSRCCNLQVLMALIFRLQPEKVKFLLRLGQSKPIYNAVKAIQDSPKWQSLNNAQKRIVESKQCPSVLLISGV